MSNHEKLKDMKKIHLKEAERWVREIVEKAEAHAQRW